HYGSGHAGALKFNRQAVGEFTRDRLHRETGRSQCGVNGAPVYSRDALGNLQALTLPQGDRLQWLHYGSGHAGALKFNRQAVGEFTRDRLHRETGRSQGALHQQRRYDASGRRSWQSSTFGDGQITRPEDGMLWRAFRYTGRGELAGVSDALRGEVHYGYDAEGRLLQHRELQSGRTGSRLVYDAADNLLGGQSPHDDPERPPPPPQSSNRLPHWQRLFYRYDVWGNLVSRRHGLNEQHYTYDADNRLIRARGSGPQGEFSAQYHYDALGRRSRKEVTFAGKAPQTTRFLWQGYRLLQEQRANGTRRTWSYDPESPWTPLAAIEQAGEGPQADIYWLNTDLNGAPLEVTDADGRLRWSGQYDTFGRLQGQTTAGAAQRTGPVYDQPLRYAGQYADSETGLHYNLFRYYEPDVGRFTTQDPVGLAGGLNLYAYAPNPYGWVDPLGLTKCSPNKKTTYEGVSRRDALRQAKRDAGIPNNQQPSKIVRPELRDGNGNIMIGKNNQPIRTREYHFVNKDNKTVLIQEHSLGHQKAVPGHGAEPHFNTRSIDRPDAGNFPETHGHYNFPWSY
ncbi:RHS repeat-associated core domain-containing protein, partial [Erwinia amylovora]|uniref:RHS repeat-associated core domain-containing protein n=1 Tax=Erwinia amylovora TaxID=552 RepID=UPI0039BCF329